MFARGTSRTTAFRKEKAGRWVISEEVAMQVGREEVTTVDSFSFL